jgi:hypothetical protein
MRDGVGMRAVPGYEEFIGAKKHLVLGLLSHAGSPPKRIMLICDWIIGTMVETIIR